MDRAAGVGICGVAVKTKECPHCLALLALLQTICTDLTALLMEPVNQARFRDDAWARIRRLEREMEGKANGV